MIYGFVLLELLITILIAGFISTGLLTTIFQINRVQQTVNTISSVYGRVAIFQNQMERDIMGAFIPAQVDIIQTTTVKKDQPKPLDKIFYGMSKGNGGKLDMLTFITTSPLEIFFGVKDSIIKPHVARVVYRLLPDEKRKNSYVLMRQEGTKSLLFEHYKPDAQGDYRSFAMIDGIQNLTVRYIRIEQESTEQKKTKRSYKRVTQWDSTPKKDQKTTLLKAREPVKLPNQVEMELSLWDSNFENTRTFKIIIPIAFKATEYEQPPKSKKEEEKKSQNDKEPDKKNSASPLVKK